MPEKKPVSDRSTKEEIWKAYSTLREESARHEQVMDGLTEEFSSLQTEHDRLREKTEFIEGLRQRLTALNERMDLLTKISQEIQSLDLERTMGLCISKVPFLVNAKLTSVYLLEGGSRLVLRSHNHNRTIRKEIPIQEKGSLMALAARKREILVIGDLDAFEKKSDDAIRRPHAGSYATRSCIVAPLVAGDDLVGVINFADRNDGSPFEASHDLQPVRALAGILAASIRNVQLFQEVQLQSALDGLTGLFNHSAFVQTLKREVERARRYDFDLSIVLCDVDRFRQHNANLGHDGGDAVLRTVAAVLAKFVRGVDLAARLGADEFAIILPETPLEGARNVASRVLQRVKEEEFRYRGVPYEISMSASVASMGKETTFSQLLAQAEETLTDIRQSEKENEIGVSGQS